MSLGKRLAAARGVGLVPIAWFLLMASCASDAPDGKGQGGSSGAAQMHATTGGGAGALMGGAGNLMGGGGSGAGGSDASGGGGAGAGGNANDAGVGGSAPTTGAGGGTGGAGGGGGDGGSAGTFAGGGGAGGAAGATKDAGGGEGGARLDGGVTSSLAVQFANSVIARWSDPRDLAGTTRGWDYNNGIVLRGMMEVYKKTQNARYLAYIKQYVDYFVDNAGALYVDSARTKTIQSQAHSLDLIQPAILLVFLSEKYPTDTKYKTAAATVRSMFPKFPTNADGGFWHKQTYPNEMWLDGIYMAEPFLARFGALDSSCGAYCNDTPVTQSKLLGDKVRVSSGLLLHAADWDHNATWCTGSCTSSGLSPEIWGRSLGWFAMSMVDILEVLPATHAGRATLLAFLKGIADGAVSTQDASTGLWCEVVDKCKMADNWTESSGSAMLVYALKVAVDRGYLAESYLAVAEKGYQGLRTHKVASDAMGPTINDAADGSSVQPNYAGYVGIAKRTNSYHGLCAILLAAAAMEY